MLLNFNDILSKNELHDSSKRKNIEYNFGYSFIFIFLIFYFFIGFDYSLTSRGVANENQPLSPVTHFKGTMSNSQCLEVNKTFLNSLSCGTAILVKSPSVFSINREVGSAKKPFWNMYNYHYNQYLFTSPKTFNILTNQYGYDNEKK